MPPIMRFTRYHSKNISLDDFVLDQNCEICGKTSHDPEPLPSCVICGKRLCAKCNKHGFCERHWQELSEEKRDAIKEIDEYDGKRRNLFYIRGASLTLLFVIGLLLAYLSTIIFAFMGFVVVIVCFFGIAALSFMYGNADRRMNFEKRRIALSKEQPPEKRGMTQTPSHVEVISDPDKTDANE